MEKQPVIRMENVGKTYQLGKIGGNTLQGQLQSWWALKKGKEDPNRKVWQKESGTKDFEALKGISCEIYQGERVGIIGRNVHDAEIAVQGYGPYGGKNLYPGKNLQYAGSRNRISRRTDRKGEYLSERRDSGDGTVRGGRKDGGYHRFFRV